MLFKSLTAAIATSIRLEKAPSTDRCHAQFLCFHIPKFSFYFLYAEKKGELTIFFFLSHWNL